MAEQEYIPREAAIDHVYDCCLESKSCNLNCIKDIPAADVVPVVRCGERKHRDPEDKKCDCGGLEHSHMFPVADDWFCADGEKREAAK